MCLNIGTPKNHQFSFGTNGKVVVLGVPILKHFRVSATGPRFNTWSGLILPFLLPLIQERQLSVTGMCMKYWLELAAQEKCV